MEELRIYKPRGSWDCPIDAYYGTGGPRHSAYAHWHPELEIMFIEKGSAVYRQGPQNLTLQVNDILITPPNTIHGLQAYNAELLARYMVIAPEAISMPPTHVFQKAFVAPLQQGRLVMPTLLRPGDPAHTLLLPLMHQLRGCVSYRPNYRHNRFSVAMAICTALAPFCRIAENRDAATDHCPPSVRLCVEEIHRNYSQRLTLPGLAELADMQVSYLCTLFKKHMGQTVVEYITRVRVTAASDLLKRSDLTIREVAEQCGFRSESLLYKYFKAATGMTPKAYRKQADKTP